MTKPARTLADVAHAFGDPLILADALRQAMGRGLVSGMEIGEVSFYLQNSGGPPGIYQVRPNATANLTGSYFMQAVSGVCPKRPASDWRLLAEQWATGFGGRLLEAKYFPFSRTMYLSAVWPSQHPNVPAWDELKSKAALLFGWEK